MDIFTKIKDTIPVLDKPSDWRNWNLRFQLALRVIHTDYCGIHLGTTPEPVPSSAYLRSNPSIDDLKLFYSDAYKVPVASVTNDDVQKARDHNAALYAKWVQSSSLYKKYQDELTLFLTLTTGKNARRILKNHSNHPDSNDPAVLYKALEAHFNSITPYTRLQRLDRFFATRYKPGMKAGEFTARWTAGRRDMEEFYAPELGKKFFYDCFLAASRGHPSFMFFMQLADTIFHQHESDKDPLQYVIDHFLLHDRNSHWSAQKG
jgi:hypothetical protein